jgi:dihydrofolate reductase
MRQVVYPVAMSLAGYIAGPAGESDWILIDPEIDFEAMFARLDAILMGRRTYETTRKYQGGSMPGIESYVFSRTLRQADCRGVIISDTSDGFGPEEASGKDIWLFGGGVLFRRLLELGLMDRVPVEIIRFSKLDLSQRMAAVDQQFPARHQCSAYATTSLLASSRVTTIEGSDPDGESQVVCRFPWRELELLDCNTPDAHPACGDLRCGESLDLRDTPRRSIDHQHVPVTDPLDNGPRCGTRGTSNLEYPHACSERQGVDNLRQARRQGPGHVASEASRPANPTAASGHRAAVVDLRVALPAREPG